MTLRPPVTTNNGVETLDVEAVNKKGKRRLFEAAKKIFPKKTQGTFRNLKWVMMGLTLAVYYITPWLRWDRGPNAPDQAVLVDLANRRFFFGPIAIWPQEFYYVAGLLIMAGIGLFLLTSTVGRAWCGYSCPQTVWVDLFVAVERFVEGDRNARIKLDKSNWTFDKIRKFLTVNFLWLLIALCTGGAWIFYFADAPTLARQFFVGEAAPVAYYTVAILTATTFVFGGYLREQVCTFMCPWPRIQAAMMDENSLTVTYNDWRGEPRERNKKKRSSAAQTALAGGGTAAVGDCVDCNLCVAVCPMGIDIRDGQQLECISCALCIDACDTVMTKLGMETGLVSYTTLSDYNANTSGPKTATDWRSFIKPRTLLYTGILALAGLAMLVSLLTRDRLGLDVLHDRNPLFVLQSDGSIRNGFTVKILNMIPQPRTFELRLEGIEGARMWFAGSLSNPEESLKLPVVADKVGSFKIYVSAPSKSLSGQRTSFSFRVKDINGPEQSSYSAILAAP